MKNTKIQLSQALKNLVLVFIIIGLFCVLGFYYTYGKDPFLRKTYPLEAWWVKQVINCSKRNDFIEKLLHHAVDQQGSLANQIIYLKKDGHSLSCVSGSQVNMDTRFRYASLTKVITAALFLENEKLNKVYRQDYLKNYVNLIHPKDKRLEKITLFNLLTHTSGFDRTRSNDPLFNFNQKPWCPYQLEKLNRVQLDYVPDTQYSYDNRNYCLLAVALEKVTGQSYKKLVKNYLETSGFKNIKLIDGPFLSDEVQYDFRHEMQYFPSYIDEFDFQALQPVAGLSGSAQDYAKLIHYLLYSRNLSLTNGIAEKNCQTKYQQCFSIALKELIVKRGERIYYHTGALPAARSLLVVRENGDIIVWVGSGVPPSSKLTTDDFIHYIYRNLPKSGFNAE